VLAPVEGIFRRVPNVAHEIIVRLRRRRRQLEALSVEVLGLAVSGTSQSAHRTTHPAPGTPTHILQTNSLFS